MDVWLTRVLLYLDGADRAQVLLGLPVSAEGGAAGCEASKRGIICCVDTR